MISSSCSPLASRPSNERRKILLVGDSITQQSFSIAHGGWGAGLADWYNRTADVINRGFSGYNSRWAKQSLNTIFPSSDTSNREVILVTLFLGANDATCVTSYQHVSLSEYKDNIAQILGHFRSIFPLAEIVLITPPQVNNELWPDRSIAQVTQYAQIIRDLSKDLGVSILDLWKEDEYKVELADLRDGLHLGVDGNRKVYEGLQALIKNKYPHLVPEDNADGEPNLSYHLPHHSKLAAGSDAETQSKLEGWHW